MGPLNLNCFVGWSYFSDNLVNTLLPLAVRLSQRLELRGQEVRVSVYRLTVEAATTEMERTQIRFPKALGLIALLFLGITAVGCGVFGPKPEIVGQNVREGMGFLDYKLLVDCTVRNRGSDGSVTVFAELRSGGQWKKERTIFLAEGATEKVTFTFSEATLFGGGFSANYNCRARA